MSKRRFFIEIEDDNTKKVLEEFYRVRKVMLSAWGKQTVKWAVENLIKNKSVDTGNLKNSINYRLNENATSVGIGSPVFYAPYVELGTGQGYTPPPEWIEANAKRGKGLKKGHRAKPFLRPAITDHTDWYKQNMEELMKSG